MRANRNERGFTLLELMTAVAVVGVLAAVVIPAFAREMRRGRYDAEVNAVVAELQQKEYMYKQDNGRWKPVALCPSAPSDTGYSVDSACMTSGGDWATLKVDPRIKTLRCTYQVSTGCATDTAGPPTGASFNKGVESWMFIVATCGTGANS